MPEAFTDIWVGVNTAWGISELVWVTATCSSKATGASQTGIPVTTGSLVPTSSTFSSTPLDTTASIGSTAASTAGDPARKVYVHLYHQQGLNIADRARPGKGSFAVAQALPLKTAPKIGTALAASDFLDANSNYVSYIYIHNHLVRMANSRCRCSSSTRLHPIILFVLTSRTPLVSTVWRPPRARKSQEGQRFILPPRSLSSISGLTVVSYRQ